MCSIHPRGQGWYVDKTLKPLQLLLEPLQVASAALTSVGVALTYIEVAVSHPLLVGALRSSLAAHALAGASWSSACAPPGPASQSILTASGHAADRSSPHT